MGHEGEVYGVSVPTGNNALAERVFATGGEDGTCRIYDLRADREMQRITGSPSGMRRSAAEAMPSVSAICFSWSGRLIFAAYESPTIPDSVIVGWDVARPSDQAVVLDGHDQRVSAMALCPTNGCALASSSWDETVRVWA